MIVKVGEKRERVKKYRGRGKFPAGGDLPYSLKMYSCIVFVILNENYIDVFLTHLKNS
jgi:hypothetical protein